MLGVQQHHRRRSLRLLHSPTRNQRLVCVVEEPTNIAAIEKTKHFNGVFHVLHGAHFASAWRWPGTIAHRQPDLAASRPGNVDEVIIATNPTVEGEATATYLSQQFKREGLKVTRIAMGIPVGSDIEYTDEITMLKAMEGRGICSEFLEAKHQLCSCFSFLCSAHRSTTVRLRY